MELSMNNIKELRDQEGLEPMAVVSLLARLGTSDPIEPFTEMKDVIGHFDIAKFGRGTPKFDQEELTRLNAKILHKLEALLLVADSQRILLISGNGEVIEPDDGVLAIGSGGNYALASARALMQNTDLSARDIAEKSLHIAADICVYTNHNVIVEEI